VTVHTGFVSDNDMLAVGRKSGAEDRAAEVDQPDQREVPRVPQACWYHMSVTKTRALNQKKGK
jgi:hypothetical protein